MSFENFTVSIVDLMVLHETTFLRTKECFHYSLICQLITTYVILSVMWQYTPIVTHDYIRMEITVLYLKISRHQLSI